MKWLEVLQSRIEELQQRPVLPLMLVDSMLPRQRLVFAAQNDQLPLLALEEVGVLGPRRFGPATTGVAARLRRREGEEWELKASKVFRIIGEVEREEEITRAKVEFLHLEASEETCKEEETTNHTCIYMYLPLS